MVAVHGDGTPIGPFILPHPVILKKLKLCGHGCGSRKKKNYIPDLIIRNYFSFFPFQATVFYESERTLFGPGMGKRQKRIPLPWTGPQVPFFWTSQRYALTRSDSSKEWKGTCMGTTVHGK